MAETSEGTKLTAICVEAKRRGMSYGQLVGATTLDEREQIIKEYVQRKRVEDKEKKRREFELRKARVAEKKKKKK